MKKAFTLVELLAVIALIGVLSLLAIPTIQTVMDKQKQKIYETQVNIITDALKTWGNMNIRLLPENDGEYIEITLNELKKSGLVSDDLTNPKTQKCYDNDNIFIIAKKGEGYTYNVNELIDGNESDCEVTY